MLSIQQSLLGLFFCCTSIGAAIGWACGPFGGAWRGIPHTENTFFGAVIGLIAASFLKMTVMRFRKVYFFTLGGLLDFMAATALLALLVASIMSERDRGMLFHGDGLIHRFFDYVERLYRSVADSL